MKNRQKANTVRRVLAVIAAALAVLAASAPAIAAGAVDTTPDVPLQGGGSVKSMLLLGDSITTGYGLAGYSPENPYACPSYGNRLAADLGLEAGRTYVNRAVNGDRSGDLLSLLPSLKAQVASSDLIIVSIGGNDLLKNLTLLAGAIAGRTVSSLGDAVTAIAGADAAAYAAAAADEKVRTALAEAQLNFSKNIVEIMKLFKEYNPSGRVIFLAQYDPTAGVTQFAGFDGIAAPMIAAINSSLRAAGASAGYEIADVPSVIDDAAAAKTNILGFDIHPNAAGHGEIYKLLRGMLGLPDAVTAEVTTAAEPTTAEVTTAEVTTAEITTSEVTTAEVTAAEPASSDETDSAGASGADPAGTSPSPGTGKATEEKSGCRSVSAFAFFIPLTVLAASILSRGRKNK